MTDKTTDDAWLEALRSSGVSIKGEAPDDPDDDEQHPDDKDRATSSDPSPGTQPGARSKDYLALLGIKVEDLIDAAPPNAAAKRSGANSGVNADRYYAAAKRSGTNADQYYAEVGRALQDVARALVRLKRHPVVQADGAYRLVRTVYGQSQLQAIFSQLNSAVGEIDSRRFRRILYNLSKGD